MNIKEIINQLTLEEKAALCSGEDFWHTKAIERLGIPAIMVSDGPHGLRKQDLEADHLGINQSIKAVCFPTGAALACSFDRKLMYQVGETLGNECRAEEVAVLLGPAVNIKRSPLCGRNFEYLSEDPYLAGELAASHIAGVQSQGVGTSIKHFAANNQEYRRMTSSSNMDERTLREVYLAPFEIAIKKAQPWTVMCSYNKINGTYACESPKLLTNILRGEWGFEGFVVTDWGGIAKREVGLEAGTDLEMPSSDGMNDRRIIEAVKKGILAEEKLDLAVERILDIVKRTVDKDCRGHVFDREKDHELAYKVETECAVLLKNEEEILPLEVNQKIAFIGKLAESFPLQLSDTPCYLSYGGERGEVNYQEGIFVGYRYYDKKNMPVRYPFGYGLSYTAFEYSEMRIDKERLTDKETLTVSVKVKNIGNREGKEIIQLYVSDHKSSVMRPEKELKGFEKVHLMPGEEKEITFCKGTYYVL